jgi:hypothetical protein
VLEPDTDRVGGDYRGFVVPGGVEECKAACAAEARCKAFTFARSGLRGDEPHCFLKERVPLGRRVRGYVSGAK